MRITSVRPKVDANGTTLTIAVIARAVDDVSRFMDNLQKTGAFRAVGSRIEEHINVLDHLRNAFRAPTANAPQRARRQPAHCARQ